MCKLFVYLHVLAFIMDQISADNKDFSQPILTQSKMKNILDIQLLNHACMFKCAMQPVNILYVSR